MNSENKPPVKAPAKKGAAATDGSGDRDRELGDALRKAYDEAMKESVPDEMLDLLNKLS